MRTALTGKCCTLITDSARLCSKQSFFVLYRYIQLLAKLQYMESSVSWYYRQ
jgi:hypothetical protein